MKKVIIILLLVLVACKKETKINKWINEPAKIKFSKEREKEIWGKVLRGIDEELFYATPVYDVAVNIKKEDNVGLQKAIIKLSKEEINYRESKFNTTLRHFALRNKNLEAIKSVFEILFMQDSTG